MRTHKRAEKTWYLEAVRALAKARPSYPQFLTALLCAAFFLAVLSTV